MAPPYTKIPPAVRQWLYFLLTVFAAAFGVWKATNGDWGQVIGAALTSAIGELARANVNAT